MRMWLRRALAAVGFTVFALAIVVVYRNYGGVGGVLTAVVNRIYPAPPPMVTPAIAPLDEVLALLAAQSSLSIVQIGSYIGNTGNDPLYSFLHEHLDGPKTGTERSNKIVLVEPIREYFDLLRENYSTLPGIEFENIAIADTDGMLEMFRLKVDPTEHGYPAWLAQLSSLKKERMEELWDEYERNPEYKRFYLENRVTERVRGMRLEQLLAQHQIEQLDLLQIDAEGYDFEILKTLDFDKVRPRFINYERVLLQDEEQACRQMLKDQGYLLIDWGQDTLSILLD